MTTTPTEFPTPDPETGVPPTIPTPDQPIDPPKPMEPTDINGRDVDDSGPTPDGQIA